jgi:hypothetical protein
MSTAADKIQSESENYSNFNFSVFDISHIRNRTFVENTGGGVEGALSMMMMKKPEPFMGAFVQTQAEHLFFDLNIQIPRLCEVQPFSRVLNQRSTREREEIVGKVLN